ncbi:hypothetical protein PHMEG_00015925 [Phytophthora megakarya]|uniref:Uncharacterized protein n=1 Tax=Phytophthora megakarya TaxID=4795 RepID=A0A225W2M5_9STRA|nr:hypothetical protein PHMEG_00015925 [Phytophthora megakarya]
MSSIIEARIHFSLVIRTTDGLIMLSGVWLISERRLKIHATLPRTNTAYVETLNLGANRIPGEVVTGHQILDFRENLWLHTTYMLMSLQVLQDEYSDVGIISPAYHGFTTPEQKRRTAKGFGAHKMRFKRVYRRTEYWISLGHILHRLRKQGEEANYKTIKKSMTTIIEGVLEMGGLLEYKELSGSCGVWCIAMLEILLSDETWDDGMYNLLPYLCMRFLYKTIAFIGKTEAIQS